MKAVWGSLDICHPVSHLELPCHIEDELHSISCLKIWGNVQRLHPRMAYLLVRADDALEARTYVMALMWISPIQARVSSMLEALEALSASVSEGSDWPYVLIQFHEDANHMPLPKGKHLGVQPQGKAEDPSGWISQLKIHQLLSSGPLVIFPVELNGGNQPYVIQLPEPLHTGSRVTTDKYPYIIVNIPIPTPEEQTVQLHL